MSVLYCNIKNCQTAVWANEGNQLVFVNSNATCMSCKQVTLCSQHFSDLVHRNRHARCPQCSGERWSLVLERESDLPTTIQQFVLDKGGNVRTAGQRNLDQEPSYAQQSELSPNSRITMSGGARRVSRAYGAQKQVRSSINNENSRHIRQVAPSHNTRPSIEEHEFGISNRTPLASNDSSVRASLHMTARQSFKSPSRSSNEFEDHLERFDSYASSSSGNYLISESTDELGRRASQDIPKQWFVVQGKNLPKGARGLPGGIALSRQSPRVLMMEDDDGILRTLELEGEVLSLTQSPRKQRIIIERQQHGARDIVWMKGKEIRGFLTNPLEDELDIFGLQFVTDLTFVFIAQRPDGRVDLREGKFVKATRTHSRLIGPSLRSVPIAPVPLANGHKVFFFKEISDEGFLPICRRLSDGHDTVVGELCDAPRVTAASQNRDVVAWVDQQDQVWISGERHRMTRVGSSAEGILAVSNTGDEIGWIDRQTLNTFDLSSKTHQSWPLHQPALALGWRSFGI